jgi:hypothetical protein
MTDGPFTDDMARNFLIQAKMQQEIIPHMEEMAQKLAAAGVASEMVKGDSAYFAIDRWCDVIRRRARVLITEKREIQCVAKPKQIEKKK